MSYKIFRVLLTLAVIFALSSQVMASQASDSINNFAFNAAKIIAAESGSFFFSPFSIISAFGMAYAGSEGLTEKETAEILGFSSEIHSSLGELVRDIEKSGHVFSANCVWLRDGLKLRDEYKTILALYYNSKPEELDFLGHNEEARKKINDWISEKTNDKIKNLLQDLKPDVQMILTNAIYFNAEWESKFDRERTEKEKFYINPDKVIDVDMMKIYREFMYHESDGTKIIKLPYKGHKLSMIIALPEKDNDAVKNIDCETFSGWLKSFERYDVDLWLPRFKTEKRYELKGLFEKLGVKLAFSDSADFSGITEDEKLKIDSIIHQSFIEVDEEKTEAAAATAIVMLRATAVPQMNPVAEFHADHPFLYFILDNDTGTILFMGRQTF